METGARSAADCVTKELARPLQDAHRLEAAVGAPQPSCQQPPAGLGGQGAMYEVGDFAVAGYTMDRADIVALCEKAA